MTRRILAGLAATVLVLGVSCQRDRITREQACARRLNIAYTPQDGATERLTAFQRCVNP